MKDFYTVQEFSKLTGVEASKLRFYDDIGIFSPIKRDAENNYRYYSLAQIIALNFVVILSELNIPLKKIGELRKERNPLELIALLENQEKKMNMEMRSLQRRYSIIHARRELINYGMIVADGFWSLNGKRVMGSSVTKSGKRVDEKTVAVLHREDKTFNLWPRNEYEEEDTFIQPLASFVNQASEKNIDLSFPVGGYWNSMDSFIDSSSRPEHFFTIDPLGAKLRKEGYYLIGFNRGYYGEMGDLPSRMAAYAKEKSLTLTGPVWVMYMFDEISTRDPSRFLVQACVAVSKSKRNR